MSTQRLIKDLEDIFVNDFDNIHDAKYPSQADGNKLSYILYHLCNIGYLPTIHFKQHTPIIPFIDDLTKTISQETLFNREYHYNELTSEEQDIRFKVAEEFLNYKIKFSKYYYEHLIPGVWDSYRILDLRYINFVNEWYSYNLIILNTLFYDNKYDYVDTIMLLIKEDDSYNLIIFRPYSWQLDVYNAVLCS